MVLIFVPGPPLGGFGFYTVMRAKRIPIWRALGTFKVRRLFATATPTSYQYLAVRGQTNKDPFFGFDSHEVMYKGIDAEWTTVISGVRRLVVDYEFATDNWKFFCDSYCPEGTAYRNANFSGTLVQAAGLYDSVLFDAGFGVTWPKEADFSGFIT